MLLEIEVLGQWSRISMISLYFHPIFLFRTHNDLKYTHVYKLSSGLREIENNHFEELHANGKMKLSNDLDHHGGGKIKNEMEVHCCQ